MATWLGALRKSGVLEDGEAAGEAVAAYVLGAERLDALRAWFSGVPTSDADRERRAAVEACVLMSHADREVQPEERALLLDVVRHSGLPEEDKRALQALVDEPGSLAGLSDRLTQPILRELILALAWELALADERVDPAERTFFDELARALDVSSERARELREAVSARLG